MKQLKEFSNKALARFYQSLPNRPCCSICKQLGTVCDKEIAIGYPYIQVNFPVIKYLVFDIDYYGAVITAQEHNLPAPTIVSSNRKSGHGHLFYELLDPVPRNPSKNTNELMRDVVNAYKDILSADKCITTQKQLVKNPLHSEWEVIALDNQYSLGELAEYIPSGWKNARNNNRQYHDMLNGHNNHRVRSFDETFDPNSRHISIYNNARYYAYSIVHECNSYNVLYFKTLLWIGCLNDTEIPKYFHSKLPYSELKSIAKSIAGWVYEHRHWFKKVNFGAMKLPSMKGNLWTSEEYKAELKNRQSLSAEYTHAIRRSKTEEKIKCAVKRCIAEGRKVTINAVSSITKLHRNTISRLYSHLLGR